MKRQVLRIVIALGVVASAASPALGQTWLFTGSATLTPAGDEASASGRAKLSGQEYSNGWNTGFSGDVSVSCSGLTANATYRIAIFYTAPSGERSFAWIESPDGAADGRGNLTITSSWGSSGWGGSAGYFDTLEVYRVEPTGYVLVLSGAISYRYKYARFH